MKRLKNMKYRAKLRGYTDLAPILGDETRRSSTMKMFKRYIKLKQF